MSTKNHNKTELVLNQSARGENLCRNLAALLSSFLLAFVFASIFTPVESSGAITCTDGLTGNANEICDTANNNMNINVESNPIFYSISVTSSAGSGSGISLDYDGTNNKLGDVIAASDTVTTSTNSPLDHYLYLSTTSSSNNLTGERTDLTDPTSYFAPGGGDNVAGASALSANTWGFALPSDTSGLPADAAFDNDYTTVSSTSKFTKVPVAGSDILIQQEVGETDTETGLYTSTAEVYYGALANDLMASGNYANTIQYTAIGQMPPASLAVSPTTLNITAPKQTMSIYTDMAATAEQIEAANNAGNTTVTFTNSADSTETGECIDPTLILWNSNVVKITCTSPDLKKGSYNVTVDIPTLGRTGTGTDAVAYEGTTTITNLTYMQDMTRGICQNTPESTTVTLKDTRGNYSGGSENGGYGVIKAKDGNCWMTTNFNLYNKQITSDNSDFPANPDGSVATYTIPNTSNWAGNIYSAARAHRGAKSGYTDQVYYNWCAATATSNVTDPNCDTTSQVNQSVCPKNWQLPVNGDTNTDKTYVMLFNRYGIVADDTRAPSITALGFTYSGCWTIHDGGFEYDQGASGFFWSFTPTSIDNAQSLYYNYVGGLNFQLDYSKGYGLSMRCVAR